MRYWIALLESYSGELDAIHRDVVDYLYNTIDWSGSDGEMVEYRYRSDKNIPNNDGGYDPYSDDKPDIEHNADFMEWFSDWVHETTSDIEYQIRKRIKDDKITLYRCITAPRDWKPDRNRHPGIYWSFDPLAAQAHWGDFDGNQIEWIMETTVPIDAIDWTATFGQNVHPSYEEEKEIRLKENYPVEITKFYKKADFRHA